MNKLNKNIKIALLGALIWIGVFTVGAFLFTPEGKPRLELLLTQNIFYLSTALLAMGFLFFYFKDVKSHFLREGIVIGIIWIIVNTALDWLILLPLFDITYSDWLKNIMPALFVLPILSIGTALIIQRQKQE